MKQESKRLFSIIIAAAILAVAVVVYFEFIVPAYANLELIKGQEESETTLYANESQIVSQGKSLLAAYQSDASSTQAVGMALPVGEDVSGALAQIYGIAANTGMSITATAISTQAVQGSSQAGIAGAAAAGSIIKPTGTVSFQITGSGSYEAFKNFLKGLETNIRIFDVGSISLEPAQVAATKTQPANPDEFNFSITVVTYYQSPN